MKNRKIWCYVLAALCVLLLLACVYLLNARSKLNETAYDLANDEYGVDRVNLAAGIVYLTKAASQNDPRTVRLQDAWCGVFLRF